LLSALRNSARLANLRQRAYIFPMKWILLLLSLVWAASEAGAATLNGSAIALRSSGQSAGNAWVLDRNGYVGTYITLAQPGNVVIDVQAEGSSNPNMAVVVADSRASFTIATGSHTYNHSLFLPAGTYFIRTELNNDRGVSARQLKINSISVTGANLLNANSNANALAASDTYIANFRKGNAKVRIPGLTAGRQVSVSLKKLDFTLGANVDWWMDRWLTDNSPTGQNFRAILDANFNALATDNEMWEATEPQQGQVTMQRADRLLAYAAAHHHDVHMHNMLWEQAQPAWVNWLKTQAGSGSSSAKSTLRDAISSRIEYYVGDGVGGAPDRSTKYAELDLYNESWNVGERGGNDSYWKIFGASGIAGIYGEAKQAIQAAGAETKLFVNDYNLGDGDFQSGYMDHLDTLRQAGVDGGHGEIVDAIGLEYYNDSLSTHQASRVIANLQNANVRGIPSQLSEFGAFSGLSAADAATVLDESMRLMFGNAGSIGFLNWYWVKEDAGDGQFAPFASLYTVNTNNWGNLTITPAGKIWQDRLGIQDWDGNSNNAWSTQLTVTAGPDGTISFNGYYGDYVLTVDGVDYNMTLRKGAFDYSLLSGDYNQDGTVDTADYVLWRNGLGTIYTPDDYNVWRAHFGETIGSGAGANANAAVPEPATLVLLMLTAGWCLRRRRTA
jgi:GH35 family endo-1,4-beta-xylanase